MRYIALVSYLEAYFHCGRLRPALLSERRDIRLGL